MRALAAVMALGALAFFTMPAAPAAAQARLFAEDGEVSFTLNAPFGRLIRNAQRSVDPVEGAIALPGGSPIPMQLAPRGFTRRTGDLCNFPPLKLDFDRPAMAGTLFEGQDKLKLVTQCRPQPAYEQLLVREYTVYRLYSTLTPLSFRVRPARVTYHDSEGRRDDLTKFAFLIEDGDAMAHRNGLREIELGAREVSSSQIDNAALVRFALFQFVIGNLDWEYFAGPAGDTCCHNGKLVGAEGATTGLVPVPYDFDFSGLVGAPYAGPPAGINVSSPFERYYRGHCRANAFVPAAIALMKERRPQWEAIIDGESRLTEPSRRDMRKFIAESFTILDDPRRVERQITGHCR